MTLTKDPQIAKKAIEDLIQFEQPGIQIPNENVKKYLYANADIEFEMALLKEGFPDTYFSFHIVNSTYFIVGHVPAKDCIINVPIWDTSKSVVELSTLNLPI